MQCTLCCCGSVGLCVIVGRDTIGEIWSEAVQFAWNTDAVVHVDAMEPLTSLVQDPGHGHICRDVSSRDSRCKRHVSCRRRSRGRLASGILSQSATMGSDDGKSAQEGEKEALHLGRLGWAFGVIDDCTGGFKWLKNLWSHRSSAQNRFIRRWPAPIDASVAFGAAQVQLTSLDP